MQVGRAHVKYDNPASSSSGLKVMTKIKVFKKRVKLQGQGHSIKNYYKMLKVLSEGMHV